LKANNSEMTVAVLSGGVGSEREVSIESGRCVAQALAGAGFKVVNSDIRPDKLEILEEGDIDVFFPALHGEFGEDGQLQQILEDRRLLFVGSGSAASRLAFDKIAAKRAFADAGVATPRDIFFESHDCTDNLKQKLSDFADRYVIKPIGNGSSVGVSIVNRPDEAVAAAGETFDRFGPCMIEQFISGRELTVGILGGKALPIIEIKPKAGFYDYGAKYLDDQTQFVFDTIGETPLVTEIQTAAVACFKALGCRHFARVDFILGHDMVAYALELNTIPGFTSHSLLPKAAARRGLSMSDLCGKVVELVLMETDDAYDTPVNRSSRDVK